MTQVAIRPATVEDTWVILRFILQLAEYERLAQEVTADEDTLRRTLFGEKPFAEVLIAEFGDQPAGFALFFHNYSTFLGQPGLYLEDIFVKPELRGHGIGKALMARIAKIAMERNCERIEWSTLNWNEKAIGFYKHIGALPRNQWTTYRLKGAALERLARRG